MAISFGVGTTGSANTSTTCTFVIPAGANLGDLALLGFTVFCEVSSAPTIAFSGGAGGTWTLLSPMTTGSNPESAASGGGLFAYGYVYTKAIASGDPGATITLTETGSPGSTTWFAVVFGTYPGASLTQPDVAGSAAVNNATTGSSPSETTGVAGDWDVEMLLGGTGSTGTPAAPGSLTTRESVGPGAAGITAILADSNASVGGAGTAIGNRTWTGGNSASNNTWTVWTIGLQPAPSGSPGQPPQPGSPVWRRRFRRPQVPFAPLGTVTAAQAPNKQPPLIPQSRPPRRAFIASITGRPPPATPNRQPPPGPRPRPSQRAVVQHITGQPPPATPNRQPPLIPQPRPLRRAFVRWILGQPPPATPNKQPPPGPQPRPPRRAIIASITGQPPPVVTFGTANRQPPLIPRPAPPRRSIVARITGQPPPGIPNKQPPPGPRPAPLRRALVAHLFGQPPPAAPNRQPAPGPRPRPPQRAVVRSITGTSPVVIFGTPNRQPPLIPRARPPRRAIVLATPKAPRPPAVVVVTARPVPAGDYDGKTWIKKRLILRL